MSPYFKLLVLIIVLTLVGSLKTRAQCYEAKSALTSDIVPCDSNLVNRATRDSLRATKAKFVKYLGFDFKYYFYDDADGNNARAFEDGTIYLGIGLISEYLKRPEGLMAIRFVFAHELAHLFQFRDFQNRLRENKTVKNFELQADCLGSKIIYDAFKFRDAKIFSVMLNYVFEIGDYGFTDIDHHGTPVERYIAYFIYWNASPFIKAPELYRKTYYMFSGEPCTECIIVTHYMIDIADGGSKRTYTVGFDLNVYDEGVDERYGKKDAILGRLIPTKGSTIRSFLIEVRAPQGRKYKKYYIWNGFVYTDEKHTNLVGKMPGMEVKAG